MSQAQLFGLADAKLMNLVVAGSILSIALNPIGFGLAPKIAYLLTSRWDWARRAAMRPARFETLPKETAPEALMGQVVVAGQGSPFSRLSPEPCERPMCRLSPHFKAKQPRRRCAPRGCPPF